MLKDSVLVAFLIIIVFRHANNFSSQSHTCAINISKPCSV